MPGPLAGTAASTGGPAEAAAFGVPAGAVDRGAGSCIGAANVCRAHWTQRNWQNSPASAAQAGTHQRRHHTPWDYTMATQSELSWSDRLRRTVAGGGTRSGWFWAAMGADAALVVVAGLFVISGHFGNPVDLRVFRTGGQSALQGYGLYSGSPTRRLPPWRWCRWRCSRSRRTSPCGRP
jgi:hypothetical protein